MTLNIPAGFANVIFGYRSPVGGKGCSTAIGFDLPSTLDGAQFLTAFTALSATDLGPHCGVGWSLTSFVMEDNVSRFEQDFESPGSAPSNPPAPNTSLLFKKTTGLRGKAFQGRMYVPGGYCDEGEISSGGIIDNTTHDEIEALWQGALADMLTALGGDNLCLFHNNPATAPTVLTDLSLEPMIATQRRRLR